MNRTLTTDFVPWRDLKSVLSAVEKPGRYVGGEFGTIKTEAGDNDLKICIVFPDLYEIAMSNQAVRILYKMFNDVEGFHAERAFSPAPDFQDALRERGIPLYSLESARPVKDFDVLAVTIGYELSFTNLLSFLDSAGIPLDASRRDDSSPLVVAGGPAMTNPAPWAKYLDGVFVGEAEGQAVDIFRQLKKLKNSGGDRNTLRQYLDSVPQLWTGSVPRAERALWPAFGEEADVPAALPIPSMEPVQDHGVIEIMRGCPNKCRFCHAGVFYRPFRQKPLGRILEEADYLINRCGYRDITLSSLSTGDYNGLEDLVDVLNRRYRDRKISFSLPSLRVNSITLSLIGGLGEVRKSGLTFAVETPTLEGQKGINKEVPADRVVSILKEAKSQGWKLAKFYFMLGLPVDTGRDEEQAIVDYLNQVQKETGINLNVNLGTFIPKPHTPFERAPQLTDEEAIGRIRKIRDGLRTNKKIRFSFHSPFVSFLEGILSRGDERSGELAEQAWRNGARFDAWDDRMDKDAWRQAIADCSWDVEQEICRGRGAQESLPWSGINLGVTPRHLEKESGRAVASELTVPCAVTCTDHCGVCDKQCSAVVAGKYSREELDAAASQGKETESFVSDSRNPEIPVADANWKRLLIRFSKFGPAIYLGHLDVMNVFEKALQRSGITIDFTRGFNPKPRIEFAQPLSLGIESAGEIATVRVAFTGQDAPELQTRLQDALPEGIDILDTGWIGNVPEGQKIVKVMGAFWGSDWTLTQQPDIEDSTTSDVIGNVASMAKALTDTAEEFGIGSDLTIISATEGGDEVRLRLRHGGTRHHNLMRILEHSLGKSVLLSRWDVLRTESLAKGADGNPVGYREAFPENYPS